MNSLLFFGSNKGSFSLSLLSKSYIFAPKEYWLMDFPLESLCLFPGVEGAVCWGQPKQPCQGNAERRWQRNEHTLAFCRQISGRTGSPSLCTAISALLLIPGSLHFHHHIKQTQAPCPSPSACEIHFNPFLPPFLYIIKGFRLSVSERGWRSHMVMLL